MHIESGFLNISFGLALFFLLVYKVRSFVRSHLIPYLIQQKLILKRRYTEIIDRKKLVAATTVRTEGQIKNQQMEFVFLEKKMQAWHAYLLNQQEERSRDQLMRIEHLKEKRKVQHEILSAHKIVQDSVDDAYNMVASHFEQQYAGQAGQNLLSHYMKALDIKK